MIKRKRQILMTWAMVLTMLFNMFVPLNMAFATGADVKNLLLNQTISVKQDGNAIVEDGIIDSSKPIEIKISFGVPVEGDGTAAADAVHYGDTATFAVSEQFSLLSGSSVELKTKDNAYTVGHAVFKETDGKVTAEVTFDGEENIFTDDYADVSCEFSAKLQYNGTGANDAGEEKIITILNKTYILKVPAKEKIYTVVKTGSADLANKQITWTVDITATQGSTNLSLDGYSFSDDLSKVGTYVDNSFTVGGSAPAPSATYDVNKLTYTFPTGSTSPKQIIFKTAISDANYYAAGEQTVRNTANLLDGTTELGRGTGEVKFTPTWITKVEKSKSEGSTGVYDPKNRTITWTITANQMGASLTNAVITDDLTGGLAFKSATAKKWDATAKQWVDFDPVKEWDDSNKPTNGKDYELGDINSQIQLEIVTTVPDEAYTTETQTYTNSASLRWKSHSGIGSGSVDATIGYNAITKSGALDGKYNDNPQIKWTVNVDFKGQSVPTPKVYDLLVYGNSMSGFDLSKATGFPTGLTATALTPQYGQKYIENTFKQTDTNGTNLSITVTHIQQDGDDVADLLEITGLLTDENKVNAFTFDSEVVDPDIFAGNTTKSVYNTAALFSANSSLTAATATVNYPSYMLKKEMLKRGSNPTTRTGANNKTTTAADGFDYVDKSVIFRLSVNADGLNLTEMKNAAGQTLGTATLTDTLPVGWAFDKIDGKDYLIFKGNTGSNSSVTVTDAPLDGADDPVTNATISGGKATFEFATLDKPYVILVKARPTDATLAGYFAGNTNITTQTVTNNAALNATNWTNGVNTTQSVTIKNTLLEKTYTASTAGELLWTVDYKPYDLVQKGTKLEDTLPVGIDLRTDANGKLILDGNIKITPLTLNSDGSYTAGTALSVDDSGKYVSYNNANRILTFTIPNSAKSYRFTYLTDITGDPGTSISNKVSLIDGKINEVNTAKNYAISEADGSATLKRNGSIVITKTDNNNAKLSGATFTLYAADGTTVLREGITADKTGQLTLRAIPDGTYTLKETTAPAGYTLDATIHKVTVTTAGTTVTTSIDGKTGTGSNTITIKNHKTGTIGDLTISKTVAGNAADQKKVFTFTLNLTGAPDTYYYIGSGVPDGMIGSGGTISLTHGQSITITGLPKDATYEVKETDSDAGYTTTSTGAIGVIEADKTQTASFTNIKNISSPASDTGNLTISKTVAGTGADTAKKFNFTVTFSGATGFYPYTGNGLPDGTIKSGDTISLAHGQSITVTGLPAGATYQVNEETDSAKGYSVESAGSAGTIYASQDCTAAFTNTKIFDPGSLTIGKTVTGKGASLTRKFKFTVTLTGAPDAYSYTGASSGTLRSGDTVSLSGGESITITGLPAGAGYAVAEADYTHVGYAASSTGATGVISAGAAQTAAFTNSWSPFPNEPGKPANPTEDIGDDDVPQGSKNVNGDETIGENDTPTTGADSATGTGDNGMPATGDDQTGSLAKLGLLFFSAALVVLSAADFVLRRKYSRQRNRK